MISLWFLDVDNVHLYLECFVSKTIITYDENFLKMCFLEWCQILALIYKFWVKFRMSEFSVIFSPCFQVYPDFDYVSKCKVPPNKAQHGEICFDHHKGFYMTGG